MTAAVMDSSYLEQLYEPKDFSVTPEKLEELRTKVPKAGPKYRLGMYFETIHDLPEFDSVTAPEDGYSSYWETDTELDDEFENFIFSKVTGDSASVICLDEAMDLLALREQQKHHHFKEPEHLSLEDDIDHPFEISAESKHSSASRHSHHSGSDGTYDGAPEPNLSRRLSNTQEHIYETLDDCREEYQAHVEGLYVSKGSDKSRGSEVTVTKIARHWSEGSETYGRGTVVPRSPSRTRKNRIRSVSLPQPPEELNVSSQSHRRKFSDTTDFIPHRRRSERTTERVAPRPCPLPAQGHHISGGASGEYAECMTATSVPPSPEKKASSHKKPRQPSLIIKHKGQTFVIPVLDKKKSRSSGQAKPRGIPAPSSNLYDSLTRHTLTQNTLTRMPINTHSNAAPALRRHMSPPKAEGCEQSISRRRTRQPSQSSSSPAQPKQVTHYGVV